MASKASMPRTKPTKQDGMPSNLECMTLELQDGYLLTHIDNLQVPMSQWGIIQ